MPPFQPTLEKTPWTLGQGISLATKPIQNTITSEYYASVSSSKSSFSISHWNPKETVISRMKKIKSKSFHNIIAIEPLDFISSPGIIVLSNTGEFFFASSQCKYQSKVFNPLEIRGIGASSSKLKFFKHFLIPYGKSPLNSIGGHIDLTDNDTSDLSLVLIHAYLNIETHTPIFRFTIINKVLKHVESRKHTISEKDLNDHVHTMSSTSIVVNILNNSILATPPPGPGINKPTCWPESQPYFMKNHKPTHYSLDSIDSINFNPTYGTCTILFRFLSEKSLKHSTIGTYIFPFGNIFSTIDDLEGSLDLLNDNLYSWKPLWFLHFRQQIGSIEHICLSLNSLKKLEKFQKWQNQVVGRSLKWRQKQSTLSPQDVSKTLKDCLTELENIKIALDSNSLHPDTQLTWSQRQYQDFQTCGIHPSAPQTQIKTQTIGCHLGYTTWESTSSLSPHPSQSIWWGMYPGCLFIATSDSNVAIFDILSGHLLFNKSINLLKKHLEFSQLPRFPPTNLNQFSFGVYDENDDFICDFEFEHMFYRNIPQTMDGLYKNWTWQGNPTTLPHPDEWNQFAMDTQYCHSDDRIRLYPHPCSGLLPQSVSTMTIDHPESAFVFQNESKTRKATAQSNISTSIIDPCFPDFSQNDVNILVDVPDSKSPLCFSFQADNLIQGNRKPAIEQKGAHVSAVSTVFSQGRPKIVKKPLHLATKHNVKHSGSSKAWKRRRAVEKWWDSDPFSQHVAKLLDGVGELDLIGKKGHTSLCSSNIKKKNLKLQCFSVVQLNSMDTHDDGEEEEVPSQYKKKVFGHKILIPESKPSILPKSQSAWSKSMVFFQQKSNSALSQFFDLKSPVEFFTTLVHFGFCRFQKQQQKCSNVVTSADPKSEGVGLHKRIHTLAKRCSFGILPNHWWILTSSNWLYLPSWPFTCSTFSLSIYEAQTLTCIIMFQHLSGSTLKTIASSYKWVEIIFFLLSSGQLLLDTLVPPQLFDSSSSEPSMRVVDFLFQHFSNLLPKKVPKTHSEIVCLHETISHIIWFLHFIKHVSFTVSVDAWITFFNSIPTPTFFSTLHSKFKKIKTHPSRLPTVWPDFFVSIPSKTRFGLNTVGDLFHKTLLVQMVSLSTDVPVFSQLKNASIESLVPTLDVVGEILEFHLGDSEESIIPNIQDIIGQCVFGHQIVPSITESTCLDLLFSFPKDYLDFYSPAQHCWSNPRISFASLTIGRIPNHKKNDATVLNQLPPWYVVQNKPLPTFFQRPHRDLTFGWKQKIHKQPSYPYISFPPNLDAIDPNLDLCIDLVGSDPLFVPTVGLVCDFGCNFVDAVVPLSFDKTVAKCLLQLESRLKYARVQFNQINSIRGPLEALLGIDASKSTTQQVRHDSTATLARRQGIGQFKSTFTGDSIDNSRLLREIRRNWFAPQFPFQDKESDCDSTQLALYDRLF